LRRAAARACGVGLADRPASIIVVRRRGIEASVRVLQTLLSVVLRARRVLSCTAAVSMHRSHNAYNHTYQHCCSSLGCCQKSQTCIVRSARARSLPLSRTRNTAPSHLLTVSRQHSHRITDS
jgi:hypothetical protein